jgi:hypothetical protein
MKKFTILAIKLCLGFLFLNSIKVDAQEVSLGYRAGLYLNHSISLEKEISKNMSWELSAGHRVKGGLTNNKESDFSRTGAIFNVKQFFHKKADTSTAVRKMKVRGFWTVGLAGSSVKKDKNPSYFNLGVIGGLGVDFKLKKVVASLEFIPSYDFLDGNYKSTFDWYRRSGVSIRYIL